MADFILPSFLSDCSEEEWHAKMVDILPTDIDMSEGGHPWNFTRPTALIAAELCEFILPEVIRLILPEWSYGEFLDGHAKGRSIMRRAASAASGVIRITGKTGTVVPAGSLFSTAAVNDTPSVDYETLQEATIPEEGSIMVEVRCTQPGIIGNTGIHTIIFDSGNNTGITAVTNDAAITGGTEEEEDDSLIARVMEYDRNLSNNYVGSVADYKRWATSVAGVGEATIIPAQDNTGYVKIVLTDTDGAPATDLLCEAVYNYIMSPDAPYDRLAPIGAQLSVVPPSTRPIRVFADVELMDGATIETVTTAFVARLALYLPIAMDEGVIKYNRIAAELAATPGVNDFSNLQIGIRDNSSLIIPGTENIPITTSELPTVSAASAILTAVTV